MKDFTTAGSVKAQPAPARLLFLFPACDRLCTLHLHLRPSVPVDGLAFITAIVDLINGKRSEPAGGRGLV